MQSLIKIFKYSFYDVLRSRWTVLYFLFFLVSTFALLYFSGNMSKGIVSLMNVTLTITPLISTIFGVMHYYNSREFMELLLSQPIKRSNIFIGQYLGLAISLSFSFVAGTFIPFLSYGIFVSQEVWDFSLLIFTGAILSFIFVALAFLISILNENRIKGFGIAILVWLCMAVIYDGLILMFFVSFNDYPLEKAAVIMTTLNPIDLSRVMILLKLDISALMGYTAAVFNQSFGTTSGMIISLLSLSMWAILPIVLFNSFAKRRDF